MTTLSVSTRHLVLACLVTFASALAPVSLAGPGTGHSHGNEKPKITSQQAQKVASKQLAYLVEKQKIAKSWWGISPNEPSQKNYGKGLEWVVTFANAKEANPKKKTLYVFVSLRGKILGSNFSGN